MVEGKFGNREEALVPRLHQLALDAAETCNEGTNDFNPCSTATWHMDTPGWALALGITAVRAVLRPALSCHVSWAVLSCHVCRAWCCPVLPCVLCGWCCPVLSCLVCCAVGDFLS